MLAKFIKIIRDKRYKIAAIALDFNDKLDDNHVFLLSAGIAFNILLCVIPIFLMAIYVTGFFIDYSKAAVAIVSTLETVLPASTQAQQFLKAVVSEMSLVKNFSASAGWIGVFTLLWTSSALLESVRQSLNKIFEISAKKIFILYRFKDFVLILAVSILILIYAVALPAYTLIVSAVNSFLPGKLGWFFSGVSVLILSIIVTYILAYFIYRFVPNGLMPRSIVNTSTAIAVVCLIISRFVFSWYLTTFSNYGRFYGAYAALAAIAFWLYYASFILLFSAQVSQYVHKLLNKEINVDEITIAQFGKDKV